MKSLSGFGDGKSEKSHSQGTSLCLPHTDISLAGVLQQGHRRAQPESEEKQGTSCSTHHTSQSLQGEDPFGNQTLGRAHSKGNFCSVSLLLWANGSGAEDSYRLDSSCCSSMYKASPVIGDSQLWGICPLPILHHWCKSTWRFRLLCSLPNAFF